jgi:hypothetical protein
MLSSSGWGLIQRPAGQVWGPNNFSLTATTTPSKDPYSCFDMLSPDPSLPPRPRSHQSAILFIGLHLQRAFADP